VALDTGAHATGRLTAGIFEGDRLELIEARADGTVGPPT
jgi:hypothetical protein